MPDFKGNFAVERKSILLNLMGPIFQRLSEDVRFAEGIKACMNCGVCSAICPAAEFYNYDPRIICDTVQTADDELIEGLLRSETIWYCGQCMSCKTRCPRGNAPGLLIMVLRKLSQEMGYFTESEKGRQQFALKRVIGESILTTGYCVHPEMVTPENHPEQGPVWNWFYSNLPEVLLKLKSNYGQEGPGVLRRIPAESLQELSRIFEVTGAQRLLDKIESHSQEKAHEMGLEAGNSGSDNPYFGEVYNASGKNHH